MQKASPQYMEENPSIIFVLEQTVPLSLVSKPFLSFISSYALC